MALITRALALGRGRLALAGEDEMAWVFELRDGAIRSWRPYEDRAEALRAWLAQVVRR